MPVAESSRSLATTSTTSFSTASTTTHSSALALAGAVNDEDGYGARRGQFPRHGTTAAGRDGESRHRRVTASYDMKNMEVLLGQLPSSPKELLARIERQRDEMRLLQEENVRLKSREVEVSALTLQLKSKLNATQQQVDSLKSQVHLQLANPISEQEYNSIDALPEGKRDLLDTVKLGIFRQLGALRASTQSATKRAADLSTTVAELTQRNNDLQLQLAEAQAMAQSAKEHAVQRDKEKDALTSRVAELEGNLKDLESKVRNAYLDQEHYLTAKLTAQVKTDEVARLSVRLEEAEMDCARYRTSAECSEQKLDILKGEYYELKLKYSQRVLELESCLKASEEKLKTLGDLELESELFIANMAQQSAEGGRGGGGGETLGLIGLSSAEGGTTGNAYESWLALPRSRKLAHTLVVTKRCLHLENKVQSLQHDLEFKDKQLTRLQVSLSAARDALNNVNSPYALVEKTLDELTSENERLRDKLSVTTEDNRQLRQQLEQRTADVQVLCRHRKDLLRMRKLLRRLGLQEGYDFVDEDSVEEEEGKEEGGDYGPRSGRQTSKKKAVVARLGRSAAATTAIGAPHSVSVLEAEGGTLSGSPTKASNSAGPSPLATIEITS